MQQTIAKKKEEEKSMYVRTYIRRADGSRKSAREGREGKIFGPKKQQQTNRRESESERAGM